jgi:hypothetical protein
MSAEAKLTQFELGAKLLRPKVTLQKVERKELRANIMTSLGASISSLIAPLLPALCSDWPSDVTGCRLRSYV